MHWPSQPLSEIFPASFERVAQIFLFLGGNAVGNDVYQIGGTRHFPPQFVCAFSHRTNARKEKTTGLLTTHSVRNKIPAQLSIPMQRETRSGAPVANPVGGRRTGTRCGPTCGIGGCRPATLPRGTPHPRGYWSTVQGVAGVSRILELFLGAPVFGGFSNQKSGFGVLNFPERIWPKALEIFQKWTKMVKMGFRGIWECPPGMPPILPLGFQADQVGWCFGPHDQNPF